MRLVVGMGATGLSVARHLVRTGVPFAVTDSRDAPPKSVELRTLGDIPCRFGELASPLPLDEIAEAIVSPGISLDEPFLQELRAAKIPIVGDIELFAHALHNTAPSPQSPVPKVIAITGSNGKSTVTAWVAEVAMKAGLHTAVGGNFGTPALDLLATDVDLYVLELSSFQLELTTSLAARAATVLNISPDHIDRHGDIEHYAGLKARIFAAVDVAVINDDDDRVRRMDTRAARVVHFGSNADCDYRLLETADGTMLARGEAPWLACDALRLAGRHNHLNACAVWALAEAVELDARAIRDALQTFAGLPHRCQTVAEIDGITWINDSKGTNLGALMASLSGMRAPVVLLAGGQAKGADFTPLGPLAKAKARAVIVFGQDADVIARAVSGHVDVHRVADLRAAVAEAVRLAVPGDTVLLSPGCASLDQFANYAERGDAFVTAVQELAA